MNRFLIRFALLALVLATMQSCDSLYKEDLTNCYAGVSVTLRVNPSMTDAAAAQAAAQSAVIYVFDSEGHFLERRQTQPGQQELLFYPSTGPLTVVGFINYEECEVTPLDETTVREQGLATLQRDGYHYLLPEDIFYGATQLVNVSNSFTVEHQDILAVRHTGQATITVRMLKEYAGVDDDDFYIITRPTGNAVDFFGNVASHAASHTPAVSFVAGEFVTNNFNVLPTAPSTPMTVEIWHRAKGIIYSTDTHRTGDDIHIEADRTTNILIDFTTEISIRIEQSLWGVQHSWKTFN